MTTILLTENPPLQFAGAVYASQDGVELNVWEGDDGWYWCVSGVQDGLYSEGDDQGPFDTQEEAKEDGLSWWADLGGD